MAPLFLPLPAAKPFPSPYGKERKFGASFFKVMATFFFPLCFPRPKGPFPNERLGNLFEESEYEPEEGRGSLDREEAVNFFFFCAGSPAQHPLYPPTEDKGVFFPPPPPFFPPPPPHPRSLERRGGGFPFGGAEMVFPPDMTSTPLPFEPYDYFRRRYRDRGYHFLDDKAILPFARAGKVFSADFWWIGRGRWNDHARVPFFLFIIHYSTKTPKNLIPPSPFRVSFRLR